MEEPAIPNWKTFQPRGFQHIYAGEARDHGAADDTFSFVKAAIINLDRRLQNLLRDTWEAQNYTVQPGDVPDLLDPLRQTIRKLLPHITLLQIDSSDDQNIRVLFQRVDAPSEATVELDELSSGEKAVVGITLSLVEPYIDRLVAPDRGSPTPVSTAIIDEPETHLHPTLQVLLIEHLSEAAAKGEGQFIIATQSPTIIDALDDESLFLLAPAAAVPEGNQLVPIGNAQPKLEAMRSLTGSTHLLTRCRPIVFLEGESPAARPISDQRLIELLIPEAQGWVLIAAGGRGNAAAAAIELRRAAEESLPGVPVFALVDNDQGSTVDEDFVVSWPVSMIENLLLDSAAIWAVLEPHRERLALTSSSDVSSILFDIGARLAPDEVRLRVPSLQTPIRVRVRAQTIDELPAALDKARADMDGQLGALADTARMDAEFRAAEAAVTLIRDENRVLEAFRGKDILKAFHDDHVGRCGMSYKAFAYAVAREAVNRPRVRKLTATSVRRIERYVPGRLVESVTLLAERIGDGPQAPRVQDLLARLLRARAEWEADGNVQEDLDSLRSDVLTLRRALSSEVEGAVDLAGAAAQLGVRSAIAH